MHHRVPHTVLIALALLVLTVGCTMPEVPGQPPEAAEELGPAAQIPDEVIDAGLELLKPDCTGEFDPPILVSPLQTIIDPEPPYTFTWDDTCQGAWYNLKVHRNPMTTGPTYIHENFETTEEEYTTSTPLDPMSTYTWRVIAVSVESDSNWEPSNWGFFTTGPMCDPASLAAPILISPANGSIDPGKGWGDITEVHAIIQWNPPELCTPDSFMIFVSDNPEFTGRNYNVYSPLAHFSAGNPGSVRLVEDDTNSLDDCTTYFWRAWAVMDEVNGPYSETFTFYTDFENQCLAGIDFSAHVDANCRSNPWINGNEVGILREGEVARLLGRDEQGFWGKFALSNGKECWIHMSSLDPEPPGSYFDPLLMPLLDYDPKPEDLDEDDEGEGGTVEKGCLVPIYFATHVEWQCVLPCPDPQYASQVCTP
jgi:hypothetical protein